MNSADKNERVPKPARIPPHTQYERIYWVFVLRNLANF